MRPRSTFPWRAFILRTKFECALRVALYLNWFAAAGSGVWTADVAAADARRRTPATGSIATLLQDPTPPPLPQSPSNEHPSTILSHASIISHSVTAAATAKAHAPAQLLRDSLPLPKGDAAALLQLRFWSGSCVAQKVTCDHQFSDSKTNWNRL